MQSNAQGESVRESALRELGWTGGPLSIGGCDAASLVAEHGSPLYVFDAEVARRRLAAVRDAFGPEAEVLFALKSNPNLGLVQQLVAAGAGADVTSAGELLIALAAGAQPERIQFAGPGKLPSELALAFERGVLGLNVESSADYEVIKVEAVRAGVRPRLSIRVNPSTIQSCARMRMGGGSNKFGVDEDKVPGLARKILEDGVCELEGLHLYLGTQCFDAEGWVGTTHGLLELADRLEAETGATLKELNFGGGFGVAYFQGDGVFDLDTAGKGLRAAIEQDARPDRTYRIELGRYLVAPCGVYLTRVQHLKESQGTRYAILDGGLHHHSAAAGVGSVLRRAFPILSAKTPEAKERSPVTLCGPLCTPADELAAKCELPNLEPGDVVAVLVSGAYGLTFSNVKFLSHPSPAELLVQDGVAHVVREAGRPEDALTGQHLVERGG
tara:strand:+ start:2035 stop:3360 length:1326 start_codon:yes stop_codon:yes gene_type:complete